MTWKDYYKNTQSTKPRPDLMEAMQFLKNKNSALDLGAGALNDTKFLLDNGFSSVIAVDKTEEVENLASEISDKRLKVAISSFEEYNFPIDNFDLISSQFSLPFVNNNDFTRVFDSIKKSLKKCGIFTGQLFGKNDDWVKDKNMSFHSANEIKELLGDVEILKFVEEEKDSKTAAGDMKHWHIFHIIFRK